MITFWDFLTGIGFLVGDIAAVVAALASLIVLVVAIINLVAMRRVIYMPDIFLQWSGIGTGFGTLSAVSMVMMPDFKTQRIGLVLGLNYSTIVLLLLASMFMTLCALVVRSAVPPNRTQATAGTPS